MSIRKKSDKAVNKQQQHQNKKGYKQATATLQATSLHLQRFREGKEILLQVHSSDCLPCDIKGKTEQAMGFREYSVVLCEDTLRMQQIIVV